MLSLRVTRIIALVIMMAGVLIFSGIADAHHISSENGTWRQVDWWVSTGKHSLNSNSANSWHRVFVVNDSIYDITVDFEWTHELSDDSGDIVGTDSSSGSFELAARTAKRLESHQRKGWLGPSTSGLDPGSYKIRSETEITIVNTLGQDTTRSVTRTSGWLPLN